MIRQLWQTPTMDFRVDGFYKCNIKSIWNENQPKEGKIMEIRRHSGKMKIIIEVVKIEQV